MMLSELPMNREEGSRESGTFSISCPLPLEADEEISIGHGSGGKLTHRLIQHTILPHFDNDALNVLHDGAILNIEGRRLAFSTDSHVIKPIFFPGGDIGSLSVYGTVNDLAMCGARPLHLSAAFIIEEGFPMRDLERVVRSMRAAADKAGVALVTGDTKVVERGKGGEIFINTSGIGIVLPQARIDPSSAKPGDVVLLSGEIANHGMAIMSVRENLEFECRIASDSAPLNGLVEGILEACPEVHVMRDPTRGGVASALCEIAEKSRVGIQISEALIPLNENVRAACELLGFDPLHVANEGKMLAFVPRAGGDAALAAMRRHPLGRNAAMIGEVTAHNPGRVTLKTGVGGNRVVNMLSGEQLPRIC